MVKKWKGAGSRAGKKAARMDSAERAKRRYGGKQKPNEAPPDAAQQPDAAAAAAAGAPAQGEPPIAGA